MEGIFNNLITILNEWGQSFQDNLPQFIAGVVVLLISLYLARLAGRLVQRSLITRNTDPELSLLINRLVRWGIIILGFVLALEQAGQDVTALLTGLGILGFTVGFALQDVSANFVSGILLLIEQPFSIGDSIEVAGNAGVVDDVNLRATKMTAFDGRKLVVPNRDIFTNSIINYSRAEQRRIELNVGVAYDSDLERVKRAALEAIQGTAGVLAEPAPTLVFNQFAASSIDFTLYYWIDVAATDYLEGTSAGVMNIKAAFDAAGIEMPFPVGSVFLSQGRGAEG
jgi:small conductance mechanosensitive channel